jgi:hypothetical protein
MKTTILLLALTTLPSLAAITITTANGEGADSTLFNDDNTGPTVNDGAGGSMELRQFTDVRLRLLYIRFDLTSVAGEDLSGATITLNGTTINRNRPLNFRGVLDGAAGGQGESWNESTISYSDAAGLATSAPGTYAFSSDATPSFIARTSGSTVGLNTTEASADLDNFLAADTDGLVTFIVNLEEVANDSEDFFFDTKEATDGIAPSLFLPNAVPEPSTALLGALGFLGLLRRRR